jgi:hypothetical protein
MPEAMAIIHLQRAERPDSIESGTPGRGGCVKVFFDSGDLDDAERRVRNAYRIREIAASLQQAAAPQGGVTP